MIARRAALLVVLFAAPAARADDTHYQDFIVGGRAIGLGGAFCALADDPSGLYYNPAGIADVRHTSLQVSSSLYGFESGTLDERLGLPVPGVENLDIEFTDLIVIPASAGYVNTFGAEREDGTAPHAYGVSVLVPSFRSFSAGRSDGGTSYRRRVTDRSLWSGAGYARKIGSRLRVGAAGFYVLRSVVDLEDLTASEEVLGGAADRFQTVANDISFVNGNALFLLGVKYTLDRRLHLGASLRSPSIPLHSQARLAFASGDSDPTALPEPRSEFGRIVLDGVRSETRYGAALRAGAAWIEPYRFTVSADVMVHAPVSYKLIAIEPELRGRLPFSPSIDRRTVVNFNAGAEYLVIRQVSVSAGVYSDFSSAPPIPQLPTRDQPPRVNLLGLTMALGYFGEHTLSRLGVLYSFGSGEDVIPRSDIERLLTDEQAFRRVSYAQSFFYVFLSSTFRY